MSCSKPKACVIGAGYAGLCAAKHLVKDFDVTVFEKQEDVGGLWIYSDNVGNDIFGNPVHSAMYKNVRNNFPKEIMGYPDFHFGPTKDGRSFIKHEEVLEFLNQYADHFQIRNHIKFLSNVELVKRTEEGNRWEVYVRSADGCLTRFTFDVIFVCVGRFSKPHIPEFFEVAKNDLSSRMKITHSHDYRTPEGYKGQVVCVVGAGPSGVDISADLAPFAKQVIICHDNKSRHSIRFPDNVIQKCKVAKIGENSVILEDSEEIFVDAIIMCTGYDFNFPFFDQSLDLKVEENCVAPLYKQLCHMDHPRSLFFVGLQRQVCQGYLADIQMRYVLECLRENIPLKTRDEMADEELSWTTSISETGAAKSLFGEEGLISITEMRKLFKLGKFFRQYVKDLEGKINGSEKIPNVIFNILEDVISYHDVGFSVRRTNYNIVDNERFVTMPWKKDDQ